jgi:uncharacterized peroxidase-related enzyme
MAILPSLGESYGLMAVFQAYPQGLEPLLELHQAAMREASPLSAAEREAIAAYVSGLNGCQFCHESHKAVAAHLGFPAKVSNQLQRDLETAEIDAALRPMFRYARALTMDPHAVGEGEVDPIYQAGWSEQPVHDAARVVALFNYMNRFVEGLGVSLQDDSDVDAAAAQMARHGYRMPQLRQRA